MTFRLAPEQIDPLRIAKLKLRWANINIRRLNTSVSHATSQPDISLNGDRTLNLPNGAPGPQVLEMIITPKLRDQWGLIIGDILNNLRASMDHIAWAVAMRQVEITGSPLTEADERRIGFPIRLTQVAPPDNILGLHRNDLAFFPGISYPLFDQFQPYHRANRPELKYIGVLRELVDVDKHRTVTPVLHEVNYRFFGGQQFMRTRLNEPSKQWFIIDPVGKPLQPQIAFDVVLRVPFLFPDYFPISEFRSIHNLIRDEVIPAFASYLT